MNKLAFFVTFCLFLGCDRPKTHIVYYEDNETIKSKYETVNSVKNGVEEIYNENGVLRASLNWQDGKLHGKSIEYYSDGSVSVVRPFYNGIQVGETLYTNKDGKLIEVHYFDSTGRFIDFKKYDPKTGKRIGEMTVIAWPEKDVVELGDTLQFSISLGNVQDFRFNSGTVYIGSAFVLDFNGDPISLIDTLQILYSSRNNYETKVVAHSMGANTLKGILICQLGENLGDSIYHNYFEGAFTVVDKN